MAIKEKGMKGTLQQGEAHRECRSKSTRGTISCPEGTGEESAPGDTSEDNNSGKHPLSPFPEIIQHTPSERISPPESLGIAMFFLLSDGLTLESTGAARTTRLEQIQGGGKQSSTGRQAMGTAAFSRKVLCQVQMIHILQLGLSYGVLDGDFFFFWNASTLFLVVCLFVFYDGWHSSKYIN